MDDVLVAADLNIYDHVRTNEVCSPKNGIPQYPWKILVGGVYSRIA